ncbi:MAG: hypothetical protein M3R29_07170 [Verrucomicrobiota bacterium]|nr:hypothetical protein [Verrucomicrobiota bacterium]
MKPTPKNNSDSQDSRRDRRAPRDQQSFPSTDYYFQSTVDVCGGSHAIAEGTPQVSAFRKVSNDYFRAEASGEYVAEAILFASISCVAAWPVTVMMHELMRMMI